jgi:hypothetical protein
MLRSGFTLDEEHRGTCARLSVSVSVSVSDVICQMSEGELMLFFLLVHFLFIFFIYF